MCRTIVLAVWCTISIIIESATNSICGQLLSSNLTLDNYRRDYSFYYPSLLCNPTKLISFVTNHFNISTFDPYIDKINLPIMLTIHGFRDPQRYLHDWKWAQYAEQYAYILLAPRGGVNNATHTSWNAQSCCGDNLKNNIDDVGFLRELLYTFIQQINTQFRFLDIKLSNLILFTTGHNGGSFLQDKLGWIYAHTNADDINSGKHEGFPITITAMAPIIGYIYDNKKFLSDTMNGHNKLSVFYQHGNKDYAVDLRGCGCPGAKCCCDIMEHSSICVSLRMAYNRWLHWNEQNQTSNVVHHFGKRHEKFKKVRNCTMNTNDDNGYLTWMCIWNDANNGFPFDYPMGAMHAVYINPHIDASAVKSKVIEFFMRSLCIKQNNKWNGISSSCECNDKKSDKEIYYCGESSVDLIEIHTNDSENTIDTTAMNTILNTTNDNNNLNDETMIDNIEDITSEKEVIDDGHRTDELTLPSKQMFLVICTFISGIVALFVAYLGSKKQQSDL